MRDDSLTVHIPMTFRRRGGRKIMVCPGGKAVPSIASKHNVVGVLVKAIARGFRWRKLLDNGTYTTIKEIAAKERVDPSYIGDLLRLNLLAPDIVEDILDGSHPPALHFEQLRRSFPLAWEEQRSAVRGDPA